MPMIMSWTDEVRRWIDEKTARELRDEWLPRPFSDSPKAYYSQRYPCDVKDAARIREEIRAARGGEGNAG